MLGIETALRFDPAKLQHDLAIAKRFQFGTHPLKYHDGSWSVINLIYGGGEKIYPHRGKYGYGDKPPEKTEVLEVCPYSNEVIETIGARVLMARVSALPPGGRILRHYDPVESIDFGELRLHIPVVTH
ncbi:MAG: aspartyl/asparaginyl beta-hydroxylase domain-containing protein [Alphaproteobacteria bacterium]|nr:aspartyl/asparaginyl beta-hydroxylase domain-containing protein [Alphaproteobacteria bacterium]